MLAVYGDRAVMIDERKKIKKAITLPPKRSAKNPAIKFGPT